MCKRAFLHSPWKGGLRNTILRWINFNVRWRVSMSETGRFYIKRSVVSKQP